MPFQKVLGQKFCFSHFGKIKEKHFLLTSALIWTANNSWNIFPNELKFGTKVRSMNIFRSKEKFFWKIADISKNRQFSFFSKKCWRHQFLWKFFFENGRYLWTLSVYKIWAHLDKDSRNYKHFKFLTSKISVISMATDTKIQQIIKLVTASCSTPFLEEIFTDLCSSY